MVSSRWKGDFAVSIYTEFLVGHIKEDAILGMSFFMKEECTILFNPPALQVGKHRLLCTDRHGQELSGRIQSIQTVTIPAEPEMIITALVNVPLETTTGFIQSSKLWRLD